MGPAPFGGELDAPGSGVVAGQAGLPATLSMMLCDCSGVTKDACLTEHRQARDRVTEAVASGAVGRAAAFGAVDRLLFDWVTAHRQSPDSGASEITSGRPAMPEWWCWPRLPRRRCGPASTRDCSTFPCAGPSFRTIALTADSAPPVLRPTPGPGCGSAFHVVLARPARTVPHRARSGRRSGPPPATSPAGVGGRSGASDREGVSEAGRTLPLGRGARPSGIRPCRRRREQPPRLPQGGVVIIRTCARSARPPVLLRRFR